MSMEEDENAAVNWAADNYTNTTSFGAYGIKKEAFLAGATHGRRAERERIWKEVLAFGHDTPLDPNDLDWYTSITLEMLKTLIFDKEDYD